MAKKREGLLTSSANFLNALGSFSSKMIWSGIGVIVLATIGNLLIFTDEGARPQEKPREAARVVTLQPALPWAQVDDDIRIALEDARETADEYAQGKLDDMIAAMEQRVDESFLTWYFSYWNQQWLGLKGMGYWAADKVLTDQPAAAERIMTDVQAEFAKRVLRPEITQLQLERAAEETLRLYIDTLQSRIEGIPGQYKIPRADWDRYLEDIAVITTNVDGTRSVALSLKAVAASVGVGGVAGAALTVKLLKPAIAKVGTKFTAKAAAQGSSKLAAGMAAKTGAKVGAKAGGKFLGPIIGVGIIVWDVWDHNHTKKIEAPILRENIVDYLAEVRHGLLYDPETGIMAIIGGMEANVIGSLGAT